MATPINFPPRLRSVHDDDDADDEVSDDEDEDDIEYTLTFPSKISDGAGRRGRGGVDLRRRDVEHCAGAAGEEVGNEEPVVVMLGWRGCDEKDLAEIGAAIWEPLCCITIQLVPPPQLDSFAANSLSSSSSSFADDSIGEKLLQIIFDVSLETNPIFFHVFSPSGLQVFRRVVGLLKEAEGVDDDDAPATPPGLARERSASEVLDAGFRSLAPRGLTRGDDRRWRREKVTPETEAASLRIRGVVIDTGSDDWRVEEEEEKFRHRENFRSRDTKTSNVVDVKRSNFFFRFLFDFGVAVFGFVKLLVAAFVSTGVGGVVSRFSRPRPPTSLGEPATHDADPPWIRRLERAPLRFSQLFLYSSLDIKDHLADLVRRLSASGVDARGVNFRSASNSRLDRNDVALYSEQCRKFLGTA